MRGNKCVFYYHFIAICCHKMAKMRFFSAKHGGFLLKSGDFQRKTGYFHRKTRWNFLQSAHVHEDSCPRT